MAKPSAIVVGAGGISRAWFPPLKAEKVDVVAVADVREEAARQRIDQYELSGTRAYTDMNQAFRDEQADFAIDLTPPEVHCKVCCAAMQAGLHVVSEKPMASSMAECRRMVRTSEQTGRMYMVSQSRRWVPVHERLRKTLTRGKLGTLTTANCDFYIGIHFGGFRDEMDSPLILDMSIHHFDLVRMFTGKDPVSVYCDEFNPHGSWYKGDAACNAIFDLADGVKFAYRGSWCPEGCDTSWHGNWRFIGDRGTILYENDAQPHGRVLVGPSKNRKFRDLKPLQSSMQHHGMHGALREMLRFLRTGKMPQTECHDNIKSMAMVFAALESSRKGRPVDVKV